MPVKAEINNGIQKETDFPKLMHSNDNCVVLFSGPKQGTVVSIDEETTMDTIGNHSTNWHPDYFKDFKGSITLTNN